MPLLLLFYAAGCEARWVALQEEFDSGAPPEDIDGDGYSVADGDCDDDNPAANPAAAEVCDEGDVDEDCNGRADDLDDAATGQVVTYRDRDGDGFGDASDAGTAWCDPPEGGDALAPEDCDDTDGDVYPSAADPTDGEGKDNDCDGFVDEDDLGPASVLFTEMYWRGDDAICQQEMR